MRRIRARAGNERLRRPRRSTSASSTIGASGSASPPASRARRSILAEDDALGALERRRHLPDRGRAGQLGWHATRRPVHLRTIDGSERRSRLESAALRPSCSSVVAAWPASQTDVEASGRSSPPSWTAGLPKAAFLRLSVSVGGDVARSHGASDARRQKLRRAERLRARRLTAGPACRRGQTLGLLTTSIRDLTGQRDYRRTTCYRQPCRDVPDLVPR